MDKERTNKILKLREQVHKLQKNLVEISKNASEIFESSTDKIVLDAICEHISDITHKSNEVEAILNQSM